MDDEPTGIPAPERAEVVLGAGVRISVLSGPGPVGRAVACGGPPEWPLALVIDGPVLVGSGEPGALLFPGHLVLWAPVAATPVRPAANRPGRVIVLRLPQDTLPIPRARLRHLVDRPVSSATGPGAILARFLEGVVEQAPSLGDTRTERLGSAAIDLAVTFLSAQARGRRSLPPSRQAALLRSMTAFIDEHLDDPDLSPCWVAAAHHVSVRQVHRVFQRAGCTVGRVILAKRLERCLDDLDDPGLAHATIGRIRARWGFRDDAVFCRAFKRMYGTSPGEWRRERLGV